jgi:serine/threonine-protein kinase
MSTEKQRRAFISYSRVNKEFATKLAKGLRSAGFAVWFDLMDIPTGSRWDDEVERALHECPIFLIILTPAAIASENVKDEIGYAIDHNKRILPLLLEPCNVPLRLRRFQYVDFTAKSFEEGFESAQELLRGYIEDASQPIVAEKTAPVEAPIQSQPEPAKTKVEPISAGTAQKKPASTSLVIGIVAVVVLVIAGIGFSALSKGGSNNTPATEAPVVENPVTEAPVETPTVKYDIGSTMLGNDSMSLVYVPAGEFKMGSDFGEINETPVHAVNLDAFWIDKTEVTNKMYAVCVNEGACVAPTNTGSQTQPSYYDDALYDNYPVVYVTWDNAAAYCAWAGRRLPTEAEWEKAARSMDERVYPWGNRIEEKLANYGKKVGDTTEVGKYPGGASIYGALDLTGNVAEWVSDWFGETYYESSPSANPTGPDTGDVRVLRGGSWNNSDYSARSAFRGTDDPTNALNSIGFRCALSSP